ncbi:hypothetical protein VDP41_06115 [Xanthomonas campestris pv. campestris]|nr:hypothetical protein [Xanthomonas campestris pv. campestris]MEB1146695.1 hypothetical protein [Xanthomonas campestris pv. campestris]MEB1937007.1 hypothetical protein [Xanthomonas campestris pv. campestris]
MSFHRGSNGAAPEHRPLPPANPPAVAEDMAARLARIEEKLDALLAALAEDTEQDEEEPARTLDGDLAGGERDQSMSLD